MSSKVFRRLATDHSSLHTDGPPPSYLFPPNADSFPDDLSQLDILLAGPHGTPYADGVWKLHLDMPRDYPNAPPKAFFRTKIWHPNVEEATGSVCVDTLKRDWESKLTLRDVLITISCLLIYPNPASALNADAGALLQEDFDTFSKRAKLMSRIHARVPPHLEVAVSEAKSRGEEKATLQSQEDSPHFSGLPTPPPSTTSDGLGIQGYPLAGSSVLENDDDLKENNASCSSLPSTSRASFVKPYRQGPPKPLGELEILHDSDSPPFDIDCDNINAGPAFSSEQNIKNNSTCHDSTLPKFADTEGAVPSAFMPLFSDGKPDPSSPLFPVSLEFPSRPFHHSYPHIKSSTKSTGLTPQLSVWRGVSKSRALSSLNSPREMLCKTSKKRPYRQSNDEEARKRQIFEDRLWKLAGGDIHRYNRGEFGPKKTPFDRI